MKWSIFKHSQSSDLHLPRKKKSHKKLNLSYCMVMSVAKKTATTAKSNSWSYTAKQPRLVILRLPCADPALLRGTS